MQNQIYIVRDPNILKGKPILAGTRISVEMVLRKLSEGITMQDLIKQYPSLSLEKILLCLDYASKVISNEELNIA